MKNVVPLFEFDYNKAIKIGLFKKFSNKQIEVIELILSISTQLGVNIKEQLAYIFATAYHESYDPRNPETRMLPMEEKGSISYFDKYDTGSLAKQLGNTPEKDGDGYKYRGRGLVMITGKANYSKYAKIIGCDLVNNPDLALNTYDSAFILVHGMVNGTFTGVRISRFINNSIKDYINARKVINRLDKAQKIKGYALLFLQVLSKNKIIIK